jgi:L-threonylcarbamoyladenylate synthase
MKDTVAGIVSVLQSGGIVLYPSDTVYGILCGVDNVESVRRIREIKGYSSDRPFILLVDGAEMARSIADCSDPEIIGIMKTRWPGKLTLVLPAAEGCPEWVRGDGGTVAVRHPADDLSNLILTSCGVPLVSTSANRAGEGFCLDIEDIHDSIRDSVDLIVDGGLLPDSSPSTIIRLLRGRT